MAAVDTVQPGWFSLRGAALYTGFSVTAIRDAMKSNKFPVRRVNISGSGAMTSARIKREDLDAWLESCPLEDSKPAAEPEPS